MNLIDRIKQGLHTNLGKWVHSHVIYTKMQREGYTTEAIKRALDTITEHAPYAVVQVGDTDHHAFKTMSVNSGGYYYVEHTMTPDELARNKEALDAFDAL